MEITWSWILVCTGIGVMFFSTFLILAFYKSGLVSRAVIYLHSSYKNHHWLFWLPALCYNFRTQHIWWKTFVHLNGAKNYVEDSENVCGASTAFLSHEALNADSSKEDIHVSCHSCPPSSRALQREKELQEALQKLKDVDQQRQDSLRILHIQRQDLNAKLIQKFTPVLVSQVAEERQRFNDWCEQVD